MSKIDQAIWERAFHLLENGYTTGAEARNAKGKPVSMFAKTAVQFCAGAALMRAMVNLTISEEVLDRFLKKYHRDMEVLVWFSERGYKAAVLAIFRSRAMGYGTAVKKRPRMSEANGKNISTLRQASR